MRIAHLEIFRNRKRITNKIDFRKILKKNDFDFSSEDEMEKKLMDPEISITKNDSLILMSFRLPVCVTK